MIKIGPRSLPVLEQLLLSAIAGDVEQGFQALLDEAKMHPEFDINKDGILLNYAILFENPRIVLLLLGAGANPNIPYKKIYPIIEAWDRFKRKISTVSESSFGFQDPTINTIVHLINFNADLRAKKGNTESILSGLVGALRLEDLKGLKNPHVMQRWVEMRTLILNAHRVDFQALKIADFSHHGFAGGAAPDEFMNIFGYAVSLESFTQGITGPEIVASYQSFLAHKSTPRRLSPLINTVNNTQNVDYFAQGAKNSLMRDIQNSLNHLAQIPTIAEIQQHFKTQQVTAIPVLIGIDKPAEHAISYVFLDNLCVRVNCGASVDPAGAGGITISEIGNQAELEKALPILVNSQKNSIPDPYLMGTFRKDCKMVDVYRIPLEDQTVSNCTWKSNEATVYAILFLNVYKKVAKHFPSQQKAFRFSHDIAERWQAHFLAHDRKYAEDQTERMLKGHIPDRVYKKIQDNATAFEKSAAALEMHPLPALPADSFTLPLSDNELDKLAQQLGMAQRKMAEVVVKAQAQKLEPAQNAQHQLVKGLYIIHFDTLAKANAFAQQMSKDGIFAHPKQPRKYSPAI
jgi:hypothetical protein